MPEHIAKKEGLLLKASVVILIVSAALYNFSYVTADPDLWGHIKFGQAHWESGHLARADIYSYTAYGRAWINHEWLTEMLFHLVFSLFTDTGLLVLKLVCGLLVVLVTLAICRDRSVHPVVVACVLMAAVWAMKPGFMIRPQLFSFIGFSLYLLVFHLFFRRRLYSALIWLPIIMVLWVNLHGGFLIGGALIAVIVAWETTAHFVWNDRTRRLKLLWIWAVITAAVVLVNPYGYKLLVFLYQSLSQPRDITEWMPISLFDGSHLAFKLMLAVALVTMILRFRRNQGWEVAVLLFTGFFALRHQRNLVFFTIAAAPYLAEGISDIVTKASTSVGRSKLFTAAWPVVSFVFIMAAVGQLYLGGRIYTQSGFRILVNPNEYPVSAVAFMRHNRFKGNLMVHFDWGEYALWKLYPDCLVSIDGRYRTVYPESVIQDHFIPGDDLERLYPVLAKYPSDILLYPRSPFTASLMKVGHEWTYVYSDNQAFVFLRQNDKNRALLQQFATTGFQYPVIADPYAFP